MYNAVACDFRKDRLFLQVCIESPVVVVVSPSLVCGFSRLTILVGCGMFCHGMARKGSLLRF